jgi:hypothetical protein
MVLSNYELNSLQKKSLPLIKNNSIIEPLNSVLLFSYQICWRDKISNVEDQKWIQ